MFALWLIVAVVFFAIGTYCIGRFDIGNGEAFFPIWACVIGSLLWPLVLTAVVIAAPFFGLFWLGDSRREKAMGAAEETNK